MKQVHSKSPIKAACIIMHWWIKRCGPVGLGLGWNPGRGPH